jgi:hypothetical protein
MKLLTVLFGGLLLFVEIASISVAEEPSKNNQEKMKLLQQLADNTPTSVDGLLSQAQTIASLLPDKLQAERPDEGLFIGAESYSLDRLVSAFCGDKAFQTPELAKVLAECLIHFNEIVKAAAAAMPNYQRQQVFMNVNPPDPEGPISFPGEDPAMIRDPVKRAEYEKAIAANQRKNSMNLLNNALLHELRMANSRVKQLLLPLRKNEQLLDTATLERLQSVLSH